jgi:hypothetical protein
VVLSHPSKADLAVYSSVGLIFHHLIPLEKESGLLYLIRSDSEVVIVTGELTVALISIAPRIVEIQFAQSVSIWLISK